MFHSGIAEEQTHTQTAHEPQLLKKKPHHRLPGREGRGKNSNSNSKMALFSKDCSSGSFGHGKEEAPDDLP